jgi:hypothetical protein
VTPITLSLNPVRHKASDIQTEVMMKKMILILAAGAALSLSASSQAYPGAGSYAGAQNQSQVGLLLPAVQAAREAPRRNSSRMPGSAGYGGPNAYGGPDTRIAPGGLPNGMTLRPQNSAALGQDGSDLLIVNNGDGSDFQATAPGGQTSFTGGVRVASGDVNN